MRVRPPKKSPRAQKVVLAAEVFIFLLGAYTTASSMRGGQPLSRPGLIALVAGGVGVLAMLAAPRIRARRERAARVRSGA
jgi:hypothetical protein